MKKRSILVAALTVCAVSILAVGSLAYFTSEDSVVNTFSTASDDPNELFSVDVYETEDGQPAETEEDKVDSLTFEKIVPADVLAKNPTVENTGLHDQWIRASVIFSDAKAWTEALEEGTEVISVVDMDTEKWTLAGEPVVDETANTITYTYYLNEILTPGATAQLFSKVTIPFYFDQEDMTSLQPFTITVEADAIQSENTGATAKETFENYWK